MFARTIFHGVIAGLDPAIHPSCEKMDARVKPAHDDGEIDGKTCIPQ
jgi:hypothetical protein